MSRGGVGGGWSAGLSNKSLFSWTVLKCSGSLLCVYLCAHIPSTGCYRSLANVSDPSWVQGWVGAILPSPPPPRPKRSDFPPAGGGLVAVCKAYSAREAAARTRPGDRRAQELSCYCEADRAGPGGFAGLAALLGCSSIPFTLNQRCQNRGSSGCGSRLKQALGCGATAAPQAATGGCSAGEPGGDRALRSASESWGALGL